jgi:hypothetical protein
MSWVIVINSSFNSPETYYGKKVVHVQLMSVSFYVSCLVLYYTADIPKLSLIVSQSEQHVSASPVYYCLLRWLVKK